MADSTALDLYDLLVTRDFEPEILDNQGKAVTDPSEAEIFSFDYRTEDQNYGTVVMLLGADQNLEIYFGDNVGKTMEGDDKRQWYQFLEQMKDFATRHLLRFELNNLNRLKYTMQGMAAIKEGLFEGYYGTRKVSYSDQPKKTRLMIRHNRDLGEGEARYRNIDALFVETEDGNRFRLPFKKLIGGRAMARHIAEGGTPYDAFGQHITEMMREMDTMARFVRAAKGRGFTGEAAAMVESAIRHYADLKDRAKRMISQRGYKEEREAFSPDQFTEAEITAEAIRDMFIEQSLDHRIEEALPVLARIAEQERAMKESNEFAQWVDSITEGTWSLPDTPQARERLEALMKQELIVGPDATNATEQLYDLVGDDALFDILDDLADRDPDANIWNDPAVLGRLRELGIEMPQQEPNDGTTPMPEASRGRPKGTGHNLGAIDNKDDGSPKIGRVEKTATGLKHYARPERGGSEIESDPLAHLDRSTTNRIEKALGIKWNRKKQYQGGIDTAMENFGGSGLQGAPTGGVMNMKVDETAGQYEPVKIGNQQPKEGDIHEIPGYINIDMLPGAKNLRPDSTGYSDTLYYRDPITKGVFSYYLAHGAPRVRGCDGMSEERAAEIAQSLARRSAREDLDTDGVMMNKPSNMSSESQEYDRFHQLVEMAKITK